ncbi:hypothetical protein HK100_011347 [Physocladia obscura]|uniref:Uncharacterized protein n=1 Tax=Physocladia obscura TaxID=109957 RepID=A0AAD5T3Z1_9FUNG|nr:hypothetical protein HK100_011347 [Physocladia obscura]
MGWSWSSILKHYAVRGLLLIVVQDAVNMRLGTFLFITTVLFALGVNIFLGALILCIEDTVVKRATPILSSRQIDVIRPIAYFSFAAFLTVLPSLYVPKPSAVNNYFSNWYLFAFLPKANEADWNNPGVVLSVYPFIPWLAHTVWGIAIGQVSKRMKWNTGALALVNMIAGISMICIAIPLRYWANWTSINPELVVPAIQSSFISFFNNVKYPPSVVYTLITLGANHSLLSLLLLVNPRRINESGPLIIFGSSSLFFYVTHFWVYRMFSALLLFVGLLKEDAMYSGIGFWLCYFGGLGIEYIICRKYAAFKKSTSKDSLWRLF